MAAVAVTVVATCLSGWVALRVTLWNISEQASVAIARDLAPLADHDLVASGRLSTRLLGAGTTVVEAVRADGTVLRTPGEDVTLHLGAPEVAAAAAHTRSVRNTQASTGETYRVITVPLNEPGWVLVVGRPMTLLNQVLHVFGFVVLGVGAAGLVWAWLIGQGIARAAMRPIYRFTDVVRRVADTENLNPVTAEYAEGAIGTLTATFNHLLSRLAASREQQDRLVADASHELRTPLTSMRANIELLTLDARRHRLTDGQRAMILDDVNAQTAEFTALINDLVHLTRDKDHIAHEPLDLRTVTETALDRVRRRGPGLTFDVRLDSLHLVGDPAALEQAVTNLLDNAVTWSPAGGTVHVYLHGHRLRVADEGPGIADADLPHVFDRFYRSEAARSTPGTGLGLSIAAKAAHDHGGTLDASRSPTGGAQLTLELPGTPERTTTGSEEQPLTRALEAAVT